MGETRTGDLDLAVSCTAAHAQACEPGGRPRYHATLTIGDVPHHLTLFPVDLRDDEDEGDEGDPEPQRAVPGSEDEFAAIGLIDAGASARYRTLEIRGGPYLAVATPFSG